MRWGWRTYDRSPHHLAHQRGLPFEPSAGRGRPRQYCDDQCRKAMAALFNLESRLEIVAERATDAAWKELRGTLWRLSNRRGVNALTGRRLRPPKEA